jgi:menaquinol-cytochrome c reductase iron-sulfur subunit
MKQRTLGQKETSRRGLIKGALYGIPLMIGGAVAASVSNYLFGKQTVQADTWTDAGDISDAPEGVPSHVRFERAVVDGWEARNEEASAWIILDEQRNVTAFSPLCTHLGCAYRWQEEKKLFTCPCHGSEFSAQGDVIAGPASRPLDRYSTRLEGNRLWLGPLKESRGA